MRRITIRRARTWHYRKIRPCIEQSNGPVSLSLSQSCPDCIIATCGYDFREGHPPSIDSCMVKKLKRKDGELSIPDIALRDGVGSQRTLLRSVPCDKCDARP